MSHKRGSIGINKVVLEGMLQLPQEWKIVAVEWCSGIDMLALIVEGEGLPDVPEGVFPYDISPTSTISQSRNGLASVRITWPKWTPKE